MTLPPQLLQKGLPDTFESGSTFCASRPSGKALVKASYSRKVFLRQLHTQLLLSREAGSGKQWQEAAEHSGLEPAKLGFESHIGLGKKSPLSLSLSLSF